MANTWPLELVLVVWKKLLWSSCSSYTKVLLKLFALYRIIVHWYHVMYIVDVSFEHCFLSKIGFCSTYLVG